MADTQDIPQVSNTPSIPPGLTPGLFTILKNLMPGREDKDVIDTYSKTADAVKQQGQDLTIIPENIQADLFKKVIGGQQSAPQPPAQQIDPNAPKFPQNDVFNDKGGLGKRAAYSDPQAYVDAANKAYAKNTDSPLGRFTSQAAAAYSEGLGGHAGAVDANRKRLLENDLGPANALKTAQDIANQGINTASSVAKDVSGISKEQAQLSMEKENFLKDQRIKGVTADQAELAWNTVGKDMYNPTSTNSVMSQRLAEQAMGLPKGALDGHSTAQINAEIAGIKPATELQKQYYDQYIAKMNADTQRLTGNANAAKTNAETTGVNLGNTIVSNATNGGTTIPSGSNMSISAGGATISPSPGTTGLQSGGADMLNKQRAQVQSYQNAGVGTSIDSVLKKMGTGSILDTGKIGDILTKASPTDAAGIKSSLITYYTSLGQSPEQASASAQLIFDMTPVRATQALAQIKAAQMGTKIMLNAQEEHMKTNGNLTGFQAPQLKYYYNPKPIQKKDGTWMPAGQVITNPEVGGNQIMPGFIPLTSEGK